ncbi:MFS general substrate transporter [Testicularia cyperi]|uniref:MFS general substrate transporter n=1 Tax=Testicularia cyperi TaxID=1882483 RepID=A0A317XVN5_9BASI|nr:MFS general substrate transporter [Testicularia cyperi]
MTASNDPHRPHQPPSYFGAGLSHTAATSSRPVSLRTSSSTTQLDASQTTSSSNQDASRVIAQKKAPSSVHSAPDSSSQDHHAEHADLAGPLPPSQALQPLASRLTRPDSRTRPSTTTTQGRPRSASNRSVSYAQDPTQKPSELQRAASRASSVHRCVDPNYPSSALALTLTKSEDPDAIYIDWAPNDPENPFNWPLLRRWAIVSTCFLFTACTAFNGCGYPAASAVASRELGTTELVYFTGNLTFLFAVAITPLLLAPLSEVYGRSPIYIAATFLFTILFIPQALAKNIGTIIAVRWFQGMAASVGNSMVAGSVSDIFQASERGFPMSLYALSVYIAQGVSPYISSVTVNNASWRIMFWWQGGLSLLTSIMMVLVLRETRGPVLLSRRARKLTKETGKVHRCRADDERLSFWVMAKYSLIRPMQYLVLEPVVLSFALWIGFLWGVIFISFEAIPIVFEGYGWSSTEQHLALLTIAVGGTLGYLANIHQEKLYARAARKHGGKPPPEARLYYASAGAILVPIGLFIFAWTGRPSVSPVAPIIGLVVFNAALFPIYLAVFSYLADVYERYASSALAAQSFLRNTFSSTFPLFSQQMYINLTPKYASTVLAVIAAVLGVVPFVLMRYGGAIRKKSRAAMALEKEEREAQEFQQQELDRQQRREARRAARLARAKQLQQQSASAPGVAPATTPTVAGDIDEEKLIHGRDMHDADDDLDTEGSSTPNTSTDPEKPTANHPQDNCRDCQNPNRMPPTSIL